MTYLILGLVIFFAAHLFSAFRSREPGKDLKQKLGYGPYMGLYSLISLIGFGLIVYGYAVSDGAKMAYYPPNWGRHVNMALMLPAIILLVASQLPAGRLAKAFRHPMLVGVKLWAFGHLLANGEVRSVILFGSFLAYAVIDRIAVKRRGDNGPPADAPTSMVGDVGAAAIGVAAYLAIVYYLHPILFGVPAIARAG